MRTTVVAALGAVLMLAGVAPASAYHDQHASHACPIAPFDVQYHFARRFRPPFDAETRSEEFQSDEGCGGEPWRVAGFGGKRLKPMPEGPRIGASCRSTRKPVVFVHGNNVDAGDWYPVLPIFAKLGYSMCRLWGISYMGVGGNNGSALHTDNPKAEAERGEHGGTTRVTGNMINLPEVEAFIRRVLKYTEARRFQLVSHSLGVTLVRKVMKDNPDLLRRLDAFVGVAGANRGTTFCRGNEAMLLTEPERAVMSCDEIAPDFPGYTNEWLAELNAGDETPGRARYMTVYDGSGGGDPAFVGPDAPSPRLDGALNCAFPGAYHNDLRVDPAIARFYARFLAGKKVRHIGPDATPAAPEGSSCEGP